MKGNAPLYFFFLPIALFVNISYWLAYEEIVRINGKFFFYLTAIVPLLGFALILKEIYRTWNLRK